MKVILTLLTLFGLLFASGDSKKLVIDLTTGDITQFEKKVLKGIVAHKNHYENALQELDVAVVIHGGAYKFFVKDLDATTFKGDEALQKVFQEIKTRTQAMSDTYDVEFLMCGVGMKKHKLQKNQLAEYVKVVPNSTIGLIDKQNDGYAYLPIGD